MIPRLKPALGWQELAALLPAPGRDDLLAFEQAFANLAGQKHALAFPYGRTGMVAILQALELREAEILCPSYTCVVVPHAIKISGNHPVFIDPSDGDMNMDLALVEQAITDDTRAIVVTSLFGHPVNLELVEAIGKAHPDVAIIQDCAHSFFCEWDGKPVHKQGICAFYGLNISKIMTSIFGGMVTTDDDDFAERLRIARSKLLQPAGIAKSLRRMLYLVAVYIAFTRPVYGLVNRLEHAGWLDHFVKYYDPGLIDMPADYRQQMTAVEARVGAVQSAKYNAIVAHRRELARLYLDGLDGKSGLELPPWDPGSTYSHFVIRTDNASYVKEYCRARGFQLGGIVDYYIPEMPSYIDSRCHAIGPAQELPNRVVNLPVHMGVTEQDAMRIVQLVKESVR